MNALPLSADAPMSSPIRSLRGGAARTMPWRAIGSIALLLALGGLVLLAAGLPRFTAQEETLPSGTTASTSGLAVMPAVPVDGVLTMVIPRGAAADQQAGGRGYEMPAVINLNVGDTIVIRNDDDAPHMILFAFVAPGQTVQRTFHEPASEVYSSGCGLHGSSFLNFTSIFVAEPGPGKGL